MKSLVGVSPKYLLLHGPTKNLVDAFHWHDPKVGAIASYTPSARDVEDHFGVFRGVDMIEAFSLGTLGACSAFLECEKLKCDPPYLHQNFIPLFLSIGNVNFRSYLQEDEVFISMGRINFFKFRQIVGEGRIYKVPKDLDLDEYFRNYTTEQFLNYELSEDFTLVAELFEVTGKSIKKK